MDATEWGESPTQETPATLVMMDALAAAIKEIKQVIEERKKSKTEAENELEELQSKMVNLLKANGRTSYHAPGIGIVGYRIREQYTTPKSREEKDALFKYIEGKYGTEVLIDMIGINSQTLNAWANQETESGEVQQIPGLGQPTAVEIPTFTREK